MKNHKNALTFIFITILIDVIGLGIIIPVLPDLLKELTGKNISEVSRYSGWLTFAYAIMQFAISPLLGALSDKYGRRPILLISLLGLGLDYMFQAVAPSIFWLFIGRIIAGMAGASFSTASAYISDISTPEKKAQNFGLIGAAFGLGFIIGPAIGAFSSHLGIRAAFWIAAGFSILNFIYGYFFLPESLAKENRTNFDFSKTNPFTSLYKLKKYKMVIGLIIGQFLIYLSSKAVESNWNFFTIYQLNWDSTMVGISLTFVGIMVSIVQGWLIRKTIPKFGEKKSVFIGLFFEITGLTLFAFANQGWMMFVFLVPYALGGIGTPALQGIISNQVPDDQQGELQGAINSLNSITYIIGPLLMNNVFYYFTKPNAPIIFAGAPFILGSILAIIGMLVCLVTFKRNKV